jgi:hypothetical protein
MIKTMYDEVIDQLKMYHTYSPVYHSYKFIDKPRSIKVVQISGRAFIQTVLGYRFIRDKNNNCIIEIPGKKINRLDRFKHAKYPLIVYYDYMKAHIDYLRQLSLPPLPYEYDKFTAYYDSEQYSKWFPLKTSVIEQYEMISRDIRNKQIENYYKYIIAILSNKMKTKNKITRFSSKILDQVYSYII